jgi:hypothetical protein
MMAHASCKTPIPSEAYSKLKTMLQEKLSPKYTAPLQKLTALAAEVAQQQPTNPQRTTTNHIYIELWQQLRRSQ